MCHNTDIDCKKILFDLLSYMHIPYYVALSFNVTFIVYLFGFCSTAYQHQTKKLGPIEYSM